jgi:hypothetical protein
LLHIFSNPFGFLGEPRITFIDCIYNVTFQKVVIDSQIEAVVEQFVVYFGRNAHQPDCLISNLADDGFALWLGTLCYATREILSSYKIGYKEFTELWRQYTRLFIEDVGQIIMILFLGHANF